jgi:hypothetical protein
LSGRAARLADRVQQRRCSGEKVVEHVAVRVADGLDVGDACVATKREVADVAARAADALEQRRTPSRGRRRPVGRRRETTEQAERETVDQAPRGGHEPATAFVPRIARRHGARAAIGRSPARDPLAQRSSRL